MRRRVDIQPDDVTQLGDKLGVARQFELPYPVRLQVVGNDKSIDYVFGLRVRRNRTAESVTIIDLNELDLQVRARLGVDRG